MRPIIHHQMYSKQILFMFCLLPIASSTSSERNNTSEVERINCSNVFQHANYAVSLNFSQRHRTSPKIVAQRTGAARFEEYFDDENASHESKLKKRYSQDPDIEHADTDPEVYQGVLGKPGVDFPVMTSIPKTKFDCRNLGNGYFADLETSCQVSMALH
jgi:hypothetical protein